MPLSDSNYPLSETQLQPQHGHRHPATWIVITVSTFPKDTLQLRPPTAQLTEQTLWAFLQQLPTRADFEASADQVESALGELQVLKQEVTEIDDRVAALQQDKGDCGAYNSSPSICPY